MASQPGIENFDDPQAQRALQLLNAQPCAARFARAQASEDALAQVTPSPSPSPAAATPAPSPSAAATGAPSPSPSPSATPALGPAPVQPGKLYATPFPVGPPGVSPPPVPTPTPTPGGSPGPVYVTRPSATPSIVPVGPGYSTPSPSPVPTGVPTLKPGYVAVQADKMSGSTQNGVPGDADGNVHIFYRDEVLVGNHMHYDGQRTMVVTGNPYIINNSQNSILYADKITFDVIAQNAVLTNGRGESTQGVQQGLVYYSATNMKSDEHGVAQGQAANVTTCANERSGYHITGKTVNVIPGDRIVITKAILWLGAAAIFFLPRVVIPLRTVNDQRQRPQFFPEVGYNSYQGYYIRAKLAFGHDQYYYGNYEIDFYSKQGLTLGYDGVLRKKNGKRETTINVLRANDRIVNTTTYNAAIQDTENFSQRLRGLFGYSYNGNFGPLNNLPATTAINAQVQHTGATESQTYSFGHSGVGSQSSVENLGFSDTRIISPTAQNNLTLNFNRSASGYGTFTSSNNTAAFNDLFHWSNSVADYTLNLDKNYAATPFGVNKEPEFQVRPHQLFPHFVFPVSSTLTLGQYNEPQTPETTQRGDLNVTMGPLLYQLGGSAFNANVTVDQYYYGTGDEKASVQQTATLMTPIGSHVTNNITYNENNYNGPAFVPFATMDQQPTTNYKNAADVLRFFNSDYYNLSLDFTTAFNEEAQPVAYQLAVRPTKETYLNLSGAFNPGPNSPFTGFPLTNFQIYTPVGRGSFLQFTGDVNWKEDGRIENKTIFYNRIIGDCYELFLSYNESSKSLNLSVNILAFPSYGAGVNFSSQGTVLPSSFNGY